MRSTYQDREQAHREAGIRTCGHYLYTRDQYPDADWREVGDTEDAVALWVGIDKRSDDPLDATLLILQGDGHMVALPVTEFGSLTAAVDMLLLDAGVDSVPFE